MPLPNMPLPNANAAAKSSENPFEKLSISSKTFVPTGMGTAFEPSVQGATEASNGAIADG